MIRTLKNIYHTWVAILANLIYGYPSKHIQVIGVTGTDGKTTTSFLLYHILKHAGKKVSLVSTVYAKVGDTEYDTGFHVSTPHSFVVQRFLRQSVHNGDDYFVMETTSHALDQNRVFGVDYKLAILTNITHEHLDYHKTYENYVAAKLKLLDMASIRIVNAEDMSFQYVQKKNYPNLISYGLNHGTVHMDISKKLHTELPRFNKYNYLAAFVAASQLGIDEPTILAALKSFELPSGRMQVIAKKPVIASVDFAHTPNSLDEALSATRTLFGAKGRIIHVFGCAAKRDEQKRPVMGEISARLADYTIITEEDYRTEDPQKIADQILAGLLPVRKDRYEVIHDRGEALKRAFELSKPGDVIIATGKGHEGSLCRGTIEYPWNEAEAMKNMVDSRYEDWS